MCNFPYPTEMHIKGLLVETLVARFMVKHSGLHGQGLWEKATGSMASFRVDFSVQFLNAFRSGPWDQEIHGVHQFLGPHGLHGTGSGPLAMGGRTQQKQKP
jgi:hypothetical protein